MKAALALSAALLLALLAPSSQANLIYDWSGNCTVHCTGVAHATWTVRSDYVPGTPFTCIVDGACPILDIFFQDNTRTTHWPGSFTPGGLNKFLGFGLLPSSQFDAGFVAMDFIINNNTPIRSGLIFGPGGPTIDPLGFWSYWGETDINGNFVAPDFVSQGVGGRFTLVNGVPEPATILLALLALGSIAYVRRRA